MMKKMIRVPQFLIEYLMFLSQSNICNNIDIYVVDFGIVDKNIEIQYQSLKHVSIILLTKYKRIQRFQFIRFDN